MKSSTVSLEFKFHGLSCSASSDVLGCYGSSSSHSDTLELRPSNYGFTRLDVAAYLRKEDISPSITLDTHRRIIRPLAESTVTSLLSRDVLPNTKQVHQLSLSYSFKVTADGTSVTPRFPRMNDILYESCFENFCVVLLDVNKKLLSFQVCFSFEFFCYFLHFKSDTTGRLCQGC